MKFKKGDKLTEEIRNAMRDNTSLKDRQKVSVKTSRSETIVSRMFTYPEKFPVTDLNAPLVNGVLKFAINNCKKQIIKAKKDLEILTSK